MRSVPFLVILVCFGVLFLSAFGLGAQEVRLSASTFSSNGDLIQGWYWLRDPEFKQIAEWVFTSVPPGEEDLVLDWEVLATDRVNGPRGVDAHFFISYGIPPLQGRGGLIVGVQEVFLPNVSPPHDPVGYLCRGRITIPREHLENASSVWIRAHRTPHPENPQRETPSRVHVAFNEKSVVLLVGGTVTGGESGETPEEAADSDVRWEAIGIREGSISGSFGGLQPGGLVDSEDWYFFPASLGQIINLSLVMPQNASFSLSLYPPYSASSVGTQERQGSVRTLCYVAGESGDWYVRVGRNSGRGEYTLSLSLAEQNDAGSGRDAGNVRWKALSISPGTWKGFLKAADSEDWYTFPVEGGQRIDVSLTMPQGASFSCALYPPRSSSSVGNITAMGNTRSLHCLSTGAGNWYLRVGRNSGEGEYTVQLQVGGTGASVTPSPSPQATATPFTTPSPTPFVTPSPSPLVAVTLPPDFSTPPPFAGYKVIITTGNMDGAGTDANVYLTLYGTQGTSREIFLDDPDRNDFERGQTDEFLLSPQEVPDLGVINRVYLRHDNSGIRPGWFVVSVTVVNRSTGQEYVFVFNRWLAQDEGDRALGAFRNRTINPVKRFEPPYSGTRVWTHELGGGRGLCQ